MKERDHISMPPGEIKVLRASDSPEPINLTELKNRVELLEATMKLQKDTISNILESLLVFHKILRRMK